MDDDDEGKTSTRVIDMARYSPVLAEILIVYKLTYAAC